MTFAEKIRSLRGEATQQDMADRIGIHVNNYKMLEWGTREPSWRTLLKLSEGLGVSLGSFDGCIVEPEKEIPPETEKERITRLEREVRKLRRELSEKIT